MLWECLEEVLLARRAKPEPDSIGRLGRPAVGASAVVTQRLSVRQGVSVLLSILQSIPFRLEARLTHARSICIIVTSDVSAGIQAYHHVFRFVRGLSLVAKSFTDRSASVAPFTQLLSHSRFLLTLRSSEGVYHSLILFRLSNGTPNNDEDAEHHDHSQLYAMEAQCPHLGADISHADIEECEDSVVLVCPWHRCAIKSFLRSLF